MKKLLSILLMLLVSVSLFGCEDKKDIKKDTDVKTEEKEEIKEEVKLPTLKIGATYEDKDNIYKGRSLSIIILNEDGSVHQEGCGKEAGCSELKGTYKITDNKLVLNITHRYEFIEWVKVPEESEEYEIIADNTFKRLKNNIIYTLEE